MLTIRGVVDARALNHPAVYSEQSSTDAKP